jgi:putative cystathionine gamma-synthase (O-succinylhomoserine (thiol)-lyase)
MAKAASNSSVSQLKSAYFLPFNSHPDALEAFTYWEVRTLVSARYRMSIKRFGVYRLRS